jgi:hypothetical protein
MGLDESDANNMTEAAATTDSLSGGIGDMPGFVSALDYTEVRDFAYPPFHPLHYGVPLQQDPSPMTSAQSDEYSDNTRFDDGPPWQEDADLESPVVTFQQKGDGMSRQYEFSVASADEIHGRAVALFDFTPENDNEAPLREGQIVWISYRHGQGWLVSEDPDTGETGLVPEQYVQLLKPEDEVVEVCHSPEADPDGWIDEGPIAGDSPTLADADSTGDDDSPVDAQLADKTSWMSLNNNQSH